MLAQTNNLVNIGANPLVLATGGLQLATNSGNSTVSFSQSSTGGLTLNLQGNSSGANNTSSAAEGAYLPVFNASSGVVKPQNVLSVTENNNSLSVTPTNTLPTSIPTLPGNNNATETNGSLISADGGVIAFTVKISDGLLVISVPKGSLENLDSQKLVLLGLATAQQNLNASIGEVKGIIIQ